jgi:hypothetical protein
VPTPRVTSPDDDASNDERMRPRFWALYLLALVPFVILATHHIGWTAAADAGDYAQYLLHAQALLAGHAYGDIGYIRDPSAWAVGPAAYPPGLPLTLVPIVYVGGVHTPLLRLLMVASVIAFAWFAFRRLTISLEPWQAAVAAGFTAFALEADGATLAPISDPGFCALLWATVLVVDRSERWSWRTVVGVTALGGAAMLYRLAGAAIVPALAVYGVIARERHGWRVFLPVVAWLAAGLVALALHIVGSPFGTGLGHWLLSTMRNLPPWLAGLAQTYHIALFDAELYPLAGKSWNAVWHVIASILVVVGITALASRWRRTFLLPLVLCYAAMLVSVPVVDFRYLWPFYPVIVAALAVGTFMAARQIAGWVRLRRPDLIARVCSVALFVCVALGALVRLSAASRPTSILAGADARALFEWLHDRAAKEPVRAIFSNPRVLALNTGVPAMPVVPRSPPGQLVAMAEHHITHLVWQRVDASSCLQRILDAVPVRYPDRFALEYSNRGFRVYRILPSSAPPEAYESFSWREEDTWCSSHLEN